MWPGASPAWRRRQPATRPRLGNNVLPSRSGSSSSSSVDITNTVFNAVDTILKGKRQLDDGSNADDSDDVVAGAITYNNGLWTPPAAVTVVSATMPAFTATVLAPPSSIFDPDVMSTTLPPGSSITSASVKPSLTPSATSLTSKSPAPTPSSTTTSPTPTAKPDHTAPSSGGFKLVYLTPILVFISLFLLFSIFGRMWGRYHHASRVEAARRARYDRRASRAAKKAQMQRIKTMWGYDHTPMLPPQMEAGEHDLHYSSSASASRKQRGEGDGEAESSFGSDSDHDEKHEYPGTFKILSLALLGEGSKGEVPETRPQGDRKYETGCEKNGWLAVRVRRWVGRDERDMDERYTAGPLTRGARRMRHALSRERLRDEKMADELLSPTSTLSVGSGETKHKSDFSSVDLTDLHDPPANRYTHLQDEGDDPFVVPTALGWRKPLPPQPQESPFRPAILNFGLRSRSKTYDPITAAVGELDTPSKPAPGAVHSPSSFLGLGISGVWKSITHTLSPRPAVQDEESFIARPYPLHPDDRVMTGSDTPYRNPHPYEVSTPTKQPHLGRTATVLHVKPTNQPWSHSQDRTITGTAWTDALLGSPPNRPLAHTPTRSGLAGRKSLLLHQAVTNEERRAGASLDDATSPFDDYSELVDCYSTPSVVSPREEMDVGESSIRTLPACEREKGGARAKLNRAKTAKFGSATCASVARSKTASTTTSYTKPLARKSTVHHAAASEPTIQPLRLTKPPLSIPSRASSSPAKPPSTFVTHLPPTLRIASPDPIPLQYVPLHLPQHPHHTSSSPPKRAKAVSNRSDASQDSIESVARQAVQKASNRHKALHKVDEIVMRGYAGAR